MDTKNVVSESEEIRASSARVDEGTEGVAPWLDFTSSIVDSLIWPIIILFLALFFRSSIRRLLDRIASVSWGDKHVKFDRKLGVCRFWDFEVAEKATVNYISCLRPWAADFSI